MQVAHLSGSPERTAERITHEFRSVPHCGIHGYAPGASRPAQGPLRWADIIGGWAGEHFQGFADVISQKRVTLIHQVIGVRILLASAPIHEPRDPRGGVLERLTV